MSYKHEARSILESCEDARNPSDWLQELLRWSSDPRLVYKEYLKLRKSRMVASKWWNLPGNSDWLLDSNVWMSDVFGMEEWFEFLVGEAKRTNSNILLLGSVLDEMEKLKDTRNKKKSYAARVGLKRLSRIQDECGNIMKSKDVGVVNEKKYADPPIIREALNSPRCVLITFDRGAKTRLIARSLQEKKEARVLFGDRFYFARKLPEPDVPNLMERILHFLGLRKEPLPPIDDDDLPF